MYTGQEGNTKYMLENIRGKSGHAWGDNMRSNK